MMALGKFATMVSIAVLGSSFNVSSSAADVFKWVDADGVTHYSDSVPEDQKAEKMEPGLPKLTVVPMPKFVAPPSNASRTAPRGVDYHRAARAIVVEASAVSPETRLEEWRAQCIAEQWVDCDDRRALYARYGTMADWGDGAHGMRIMRRPRHVR